jgi:hypothetical protein
LDVAVHGLSKALLPFGDQPQLLVSEIVGKRAELRRLTANLGEVTPVQCGQD